MNGELYFEEHPWLRCCDTIEKRNLGPVHEIAIQVVCPEGATQAVFQTWLSRCEALLKAPLSGDTLSTERIISYVGSVGECVVRIFVDASGAETTENFEIVTARSLLVWKPGTSLQGRTSGGYTCCKQYYVADLEVKA